MRSWQLTHEVSAMRAGVTTIDDDLSFLYGQLPDRIRSAAAAVKCGFGGERRRREERGRRANDVAEDKRQSLKSELCRRTCFV